MTKDLRWIALALLSLSACAGQEHGMFDDGDAVVVEGRSDALSLYGREIHIDPCDWEDSKAGNNVCRQTHSPTGRECVFDSQGRPANPNGVYSVFTTGGSTLAWGESIVYHSSRSSRDESWYPNMYCSDEDRFFSVLAGRSGSVIARIPGNYDNVIEGPVRGTVTFEPSFAVPWPGGRYIPAGNYVLVLQKQGEDGSWTDIATRRSIAWNAAPTRIPFTLEVSARVKPNTPVRLEFRTGGNEARDAVTYVTAMRLFSPVCVPDASGTRCL